MLCLKYYLTFKITTKKLALVRKDRCRQLLDYTTKSKNISFKFTTSAIINIIITTQTVSSETKQQIPSAKPD